MSSANIELAVQRGKGESAVHRIGGRDGAPLHISAQSGANYLLKREDGEAPENVTLKRSGDDLEVTLEGDAAPSVVIEDYFSQAQSPGLFGKDATGQLHEFVRTDGQGGIFTLKEGETEAAALGTAPASLNDDDGNGFIGLLPLLLAGAGLAGLAAYAIAKNDDDEPEPPVRQPAGGVESADDDVGTITGPIAAGGVTDDAIDRKSVV